MYNSKLPPDEAAVDFLKKFHIHDPGSFPGVMTSLGCSSYELLAQVIQEVTEAPIKILDLACGDGELVETLLARFGDRCQVVGIDMSPDQVEKAKARFPQQNVCFQCNMAQQLSLPTASMDYILCHMSLMLMRPVEPVLAEIGRVLKSGGVFSAIVGRVAGGQGIDAKYAEFAQKVASRNIPTLVEMGLGDGRVLSENGMTALVAQTGLFEPPTFRDFNFEFYVTAEEYLAFIQRNYFWSAFPAEAQAAITTKIYQLFEPYNGRRVCVPMAVRQITMIGRT